MKAPNLQAILAELFNHFVRDMLERNSIDKSEAKLSSKNTVNFLLKNTAITKPAIRDNSIKETIVQESKKATVKQVYTKENNIQLVNSKGKNVNSVNSNDKVAKMIDSQLSTINGLKKIDTAPVDTVILGKEVSKISKTNPMEVTDSLNVAEKEVEKRECGLKKLSPTVNIKQNNIEHSRVLIKICLTMVDAFILAHAQVS